MLLKIVNTLGVCHAGYLLATRVTCPTLVGAMFVMRRANKGEQMRLVWLVLLLVSCGEPAGAQLGSSCSSYRPCATNLVCENGSCAYDTRQLKALAATGPTGPSAATGPKCGASLSSCFDSNDCCSGSYCSASSSKCFTGCRDDRDDCTKDSDCCSGDCSTSGYCQ
jgi:hypothetical protein